MAKRTQQVKRSRLVITGVALVVLIVVLAAIGYHVFKPTKLTTNNVTPPSKHTTTTKPEPSAPVDAGDANKTQTQTQTQTSTQSVTSSGSSSISISSFTVTYQGAGKVHVATQISGASTSNDCMLTLTSPSGGTQTVPGNVAWSGTYYLCSFDQIQNVTGSGTWSAELMVMSGSTTSADSKTTFTVGS